MSSNSKTSPTAKPTANRRSKVLPELNKKDLGNLIPKRGGKLTPKIGRMLMKSAGWKTVGSIPNISQAVVLAVPHTSNIDGIYALPCLFALDLKISIMGKHTLFKIPVLAQPKAQCYKRVSISLKIIRLCFWVWRLKARANILTAGKQGFITWQ